MRPRVIPLPFFSHVDARNCKQMPIFKYVNIRVVSGCLKNGARFNKNRCKYRTLTVDRLVKSNECSFYQLEDPAKYPFACLTSIDKDTGKLWLRKVALLNTWYILQKHIDTMNDVPSDIPMEMNMKPPENVRGMKVLDQAEFKKIVTIPTLLVPFKVIGKLSQLFKGSLVRQPGIKPVADISPECAEEKGKLFLFNPEKYKTTEDFSQEEKQLLATNGVDLATWRIIEMDLSYENWSYHDVLDAILPADSDGVATFSTIGHILHLNLKESLLEYKHIIGEVLLNKIPYARTVVNKTGAIDNTFRNFKMEVLAGEEDFVATVKENSLSFEMDFSKVYWNPRLGTEHQRIVNLLNRDDIVYDVFAGIGPFAVPASRKQCYVFANDLNPESYKWLKRNMELNKVKLPGKTYNMDGRDFIRTIVKSDLLERWKQEKDRNYCIHMMMNLPALAVEFLDTLPGLMKGVDRECLKSMELPLIHCYSFSTSDDPKQDLRERVEQTLGTTLCDDHKLRIVRNVAPNKDMLCITFTLPEEVLFRSSSHPVAQQPELQENVEEPEQKKCRVDTGS